METRLEDASACSEACKVEQLRQAPSSQLSFALEASKLWKPEIGGVRCHKITKIRQATTASLHQGQIEKYKNISKRKMHCTRHLPRDSCTNCWQLGPCAKQRQGLKWLDRFDAFCTGWRSGRRTPIKNMVQPSVAQQCYCWHLDWLACFPCFAYAPINARVFRMFHLFGVACSIRLQTSFCCLLWHASQSQWTSPSMIVWENLHVFLKLKTFKTTLWINNPHGT